MAATNPGQRLQEARLTALHGVSRGPVREALNTLAAMHLVDLTPRRGAHVRMLGVDEAIDTLIVAQTLIGLSAQLAALCTDAAARARLGEALDALAMFAADDVGSQHAVKRDGFYAALTAMAANAELSRVLPTVRVHLIRIQFRAVLRFNDASRLRDYRRIAEAVLLHRPREAEAAARLHLGRAIDRMRAFSTTDR